VIWHDGRLVVRRERRLGREQTALPGGRVKDRETVADALHREVAEETGLAIEIRPLIYVAEVVYAVETQHIELVFLAEPRSPLDPASVELMTLDEAKRAPLMPPITADIERDLAAGWTNTPRWLGNLWDSRLAPRP
jgi:ADP-ribose pyrophosphatase YjhB (NUDIX family)